MNFNPRWFKLVTIEPVMLAEAFCRGLTSPPMSALWYRKVCLHYFDEQICHGSHSGNHTCGEGTIGQNISLVQQETSKWMFYGHMCFMIPCMYVGLIYGSWGDIFNRKLHMLIPLCFAISGHLADLLNGMYMKGPLAFMLLGSFVTGLGGGHVCVLASCFSYLSEVVDHADRSTRISIAYSISFAGMCAASLISGYLLEKTSFVLIFSISIATYCLNILYVVFLLPNITLGHKEKDKINYNHAEEKQLNWKEGDKDTTDSDISESGRIDEYFSQDRGASEVHISSSMLTKLRSACSLSHMWKAVMVMGRKRANHGRAHLLALLLAIFVMLMASAHGVTYLFLKLPPRCFTQSMYGVLVSYNTALTGLTLLLFIPLLKKYFKFKDLTVMIIGTISGIAGQILMAFSATVWMVYWVPIVHIPAHGIITCLRGYSSTLVEPDELELSMLMCDVRARNMGHLSMNLKRCYRDNCVRQQAH